MIRTLITVPYEFARLPLVILESALSTRLPGTSPARLTLDRAIGSVDRAAGALIGDREIAKRGSDRVAHVAKVRAAARLEQQATSLREQADETALTGTRQAAQKRRAVQSRARSGLDEAAVKEARGKQRAKATAVQTASARKAAADHRAADVTATVERRKQRVNTAADAQKRAAQGRTKAVTAAARESKQRAGEARADAERLGDLAAARKRTPKQG